VLDADNVHGEEGLHRKVYHALISLSGLLLLLPPSGITLHSVVGYSQTFQILTKHIGKTIYNYDTKYMQYENIFYDNSNDGYFILEILIFFLIRLVKIYKV
jgi:hypothetical protein